MRAGGTNMAAPKPIALLVVLGLFARSVAAAGNNTVTQWQYVAQQVARDEKLPHQIAVRVFSLVALATHGAFVVDKALQFQSNATALAAFTGHYVLSELYPNQQFKFDIALQKQLAGGKDLANPSKSQAYKIAVKVGSKLLKHRVNDGSQLFVKFVPSPPGGPVGKYQFTPNQTYALYPQLAKTLPFTNPSSDAFTESFKAFQIGDPEYDTQLARVESIGRNHSTTRTADQTQIAKFWAGVAGTKTYGGYAATVQLDLLKPADLASLRRTARQLALFFTTAYDTNIGVWYIKYTQLFWRPITAIHQGDGKNAADPSWTPLLAPTPPHPEYPSGHQATTGAALAILTHYVGGDNINVTVVSDDVTTPQTRTYTSLQDYAAEVGDSRVFGGLHFDKSSTDSLAYGGKVAAYALAHFDQKWGKLSAFL